MEYTHINMGCMHKNSLICLVVAHLFSSSTVIRSMYKSITSDYMREFFLPLLFFFFPFVRGSGCGAFLVFVLVFFWGESLQTLLESQYLEGFLQDRDQTLECQMKSLSRKSTQSWGLD